ncbi:hypothetical protein [Ilumatobacter sp.]|uniref:hypothetical protein n=1 Tax=Ilumatobacter sp. TaxID=1967498 RepID=UPI003F6C8C2D
MFEHEIGGTVQCDSGLAGSWPALHDEDLINVGADNDVLFALNRGDDFAHLTTALGTDLSEYRVRDATGDVAPVRVIELFVEIRDEFAVVQREPTPKSTPSASTAVAR